MAFVNDLYKLKSVPDVVQDMMNKNTNFSDIATVDEEKSAGDAEILSVLSFQPTYLNYAFDSNKKKLLERSQLVLTVSILIPASDEEGPERQLYRRDFPVTLDKEGLLPFDNKDDVRSVLEDTAVCGGRDTKDFEGLPNDHTEHVVAHHRYGRFSLPTRGSGVGSAILVPFATCHSILYITLSRIVAYPHCEMLGEIKIDISNYLYNKKCVMIKRYTTHEVSISPLFFDGCELDLRHKRNAPAPVQNKHHTKSTHAFEAQKAPNVKPDNRSAKDVIVATCMTVTILPISKENYNFSGSIYLLPGGNINVKNRHYAVLIDGVLMVYKYPGAKLDLCPVRNIIVDAKVTLCRLETTLKETISRPAASSSSGIVVSDNDTSVHYIRLRDKNGPLWLQSTKGNAETADWWNHLATLAGNTVNKTKA